MATPVISPSAFTTGEVSPSLFGNVTLARMHAAASTMRNFFIRYSGGAYSRDGAGRALKADRAQLSAAADPISIFDQPGALPGVRQLLHAGGAERGLCDRRPS